MAGFCAIRFCAALPCTTTTTSTTTRSVSAIAAVLQTPPERRHRLLRPLPPCFPPLIRGPAASASGVPCCPAFSSSRPEAMEFVTPGKRAPPWKPMCLYYTQGKCTMMNDSLHLEKFNHNFSVDLQVTTSKLNHLCSQDFDYLPVLDLEGKDEILEFPVVVIDARTADFVDAFHRFVRPCRMSEQRINQYIEGKYGNFGVDCVWHDTAIPFKDVLKEFEAWMVNHNFWRKLSGSLHRAAFVTCGNWDVKTKIPQQCKDSGVTLPSYFMEWINLKDIFLNFYKRRASGMKTMMRELNIPLVGNHHLGVDDSKNIARVLQRMIADGVFLQITARRIPSHPYVKYVFEDRIG